MKLALVKEPMYRLAPAIEHGERRINGSVVRKQPFDRQMWLERHSRKRQEAFVERYATPLSLKAGARKLKDFDDVQAGLMALRGGGPTWMVWANGAPSSHTWHMRDLRGALAALLGCDERPRSVSRAEYRTILYVDCSVDLSTFRLCARGKRCTSAKPKSRVGSYVLKYVGSTLRSRLTCRRRRPGPARSGLYGLRALKVEPVATNASRSSHQSAARAVLRSTPHGHGHKMR